MNVTRMDIPDILRLEWPVFSDDRGWFQEFWNPGRQEHDLIGARFVQDNVARSRAGVCRGLHFQEPFRQAKLITVIEGEIFDVAVDVRLKSPTFGEHVAATLGLGQALYIPEGFAHGYQVVGDSATVLYKCTDVYHPEAEMTLLWNDPELAISWPLRSPITSEKDQRGLPLDQLRRRLASLNPNA